MFFRLNVNVKSTRSRLEGVLSFRGEKYRVEVRGGRGD